MKSLIRPVLVTVAACFVLTPSVQAQQPSPPDIAAERRQVAAVVDSALAALSRGDLAGFTDYMVEEAITMSVRQQGAQFLHSARTRQANRTMAMPGRITERAFGTQVQVQGPIATAWAPYDLYIDDKWSHCGVDAFTLLKTGGVWKISTLVWSVEQPPACAKHPDGPPRR